MIDEDDIKTLSNLKFIGQITPHRKINFSNYTMMPNNFITVFKRTFIYTDSRYKSLEFLEETITKSFKIVEKYKESKKNVDMYLNKNIIIDIIKCIKGIDSMRITYARDIKYVSHLQILRETIIPRVLDETKDNELVSNDETIVNMLKNYTEV